MENRQINIKISALITYIDTAKPAIYMFADFMLK